MTREEIREIIREVFAEESRLRIEQEDKLVLKTVSGILRSFGMNDDDQKEVRADFIHLRKWRQSVEQVERMGWGAIVTVLVSGFLGVVWLGFKALFGKG